MMVVPVTVVPMMVAADVNADIADVQANTH